MLESDLAEQPPATATDLNETTLEAGAWGHASHTSVFSIALVAVSTVVGAAAQILLRFGADNLNGTGLRGILTNWPLIGGYVCLGVMTILVVLALRGGQLSVLYPIIALTYVWVTILSPRFFEDVINKRPKSSALS